MEETVLREQGLVLLIYAFGIREREKNGKGDEHLSRRHLSLFKLKHNCALLLYRRKRICEKINNFKFKSS